MLDLLGGDYYLDHENFIEGDQNSNSQVVNHVIYKGDKFGQDYRINSTRVSFYQQWSQRFRRFDWIIGLEEGLNWNSLKRNYQNKIFSNQNANDKFFKNLQWGVKSNLTYKINGRNYLIWNFGVNYLNPNTEQIYINPAWRADKLPVEDQTKVFSGILTYKYQSPNFKIHFAAYSSWFLDQILTRRFYLDAGSEEDPDSELLDGGFINGFYTNLDQQHLGLELAIQYTITPKLELSLVGQKGEYIYINRPNYYIYDQYSSSSDIKLIYLKNFYVAGTPQSAISAQIKYEIFNHATLRLSANYFSANFVEINPLRRISEAVAGVERNSTEFQAIVDQEKLNNAFVVNASIYKSWKVQNHFLSLSLNVNNILNNRNLISGGFEQSRFDYSEKIVSKFPNKYFHLQGINYFLSLNYSLN